MSLESQLEEAVCFAALNVSDPGLRANFLDRACAGDARFRSAVEAMLLAHADAEKFFEQGRAAVNTPEVDAHAAVAIKALAGEIDFADEPSGSRVGRYRLLQKIGEGGCGTVYLAEQQEPVRRQVALKVIKLGMDTKNVVARFEAERQALAMMDHPNIARVLDAGATETGRPFFVMELVRGVRITKYCDDQKLDTVQRLELFILVCRAIQHAHQKGVIHRDIKPSNILVALHDGLPVPKVIDFGIAKATEGRLTEHTQFTAVEHFVGTPVYMSPEQAEGSGLDIDTRSDIYSLGVLLYELLTGRTPFDTKLLMQSGLDEMRWKLRNQDPQLPSTMITSLRRTELTLAASQRHAEPPKLISQLKGDLDWIVMKALEKDRNRRYDTANGMAMDIQRHLDSEPVVARPPGRVYRLQKLVRRNKIIFSAGTAVALALLVGLGMSTWLFIRERAARERETQLRAAAEDRAKITQAVMLVAQGNFEDANQILDQIKTPASAASLDRVSAYRSVGEWLALQGRWKASAERYAGLLKIDTFDRQTVVVFDYQSDAVVLVEAGDPEAYEQFCRMAVTNFAGDPSESILFSCLLRPLGQRQSALMKPMADALVSRLKALPNDKVSPWTRMPIGLWKYRCGDYQAAADWCERGLEQKGRFPACDADLHGVLAMAWFQLGKMDAAHLQLAQGRQLVEARFKSQLDHGRSPAGYWFDWIFARLILQEAGALIEGNAASPEAN